MSNRQDARPDAAVVEITAGRVVVLPPGAELVPVTHVIELPADGRPVTIPLRPTVNGRDDEPLTLRNAPEPQARDLVSRTLSFRAATLDEGTRSVEVVMTTDAPVSVYDWRSGDIIDEVLIAEGGQFSDQLPFLANHYRWDFDSVLGSVRAIKREGGTWVGRAYFAEGDEDADKAWNKVRQGHLRDVSVGYRTTDYQDIPAGTSATVNGRTYTAGQRTLRISRRWEAKELSLVPIGADSNTKVRTAGDPAKEHVMDPQLRKYLESIGLRSDASEAEAQAFLRGLGGKLKTRADAIAGKTLTVEQALEQHRADYAPPAPQPQPEAQRGAAGGIPAPAPQPAHVAGTATPDQLREEAVRAERERVTQIRQLAGDDVPPEVLTRAEREGWDTARASREFLTAVRESRQAAVGGGATGAAGRLVEAARTAALMGLALAIRGGEVGDRRIEQTIRRNPHLRSDRWENVAERAEAFSDLSLYEMCQRAIQLDGGTQPTGRHDTIRAAVSGSGLTQIFTTSVNARLMMAWEEVGDTTIGWVDEVDVADFKTMDEIDFQGNSRLERLGRGQTAKDADAEDGKESWKIARYAKKFSIDEQDIIDDNFSVLTQMPRIMGEAARNLRPDLVYALVLANPALGADGKAVFHADHGNLSTGAPSSLQKSSLETAIVAMSKQTIRSGKNARPLNIAPRFLLVPQDLLFTGSELVTSATIMKSTGSDKTVEFGRNVISDLNLQVRADARLGVTGVIDPVTDARRVGTATNWFLAANPGRTLKVGYLRGTGRAPMLRSYTLDKGQWGIGWDVKLDIGAAWMDYRGVHKSTGA